MVSPAQAAIGQFLDAVGQPALQKAAVIGRWLGIEKLAPAGLQNGGGGAFQGRQLGQNAGFSRANFLGCASDITPRSARPQSSGDFASARNLSTGLPLEKTQEAGGEDGRELG